MDEPQQPPGLHSSPFMAAAQQAATAKPKVEEQFMALSHQVSELLSRLRLLEERYANLRREHQTMSQNMIEHHQNLSKQQRKLTDSLVAVKRDIADLKERLSAMQGDLSDAARIHDLKMLDRYLDFWQPSRYLTRQEAERLIAQALEAKAKRL